MRNRPTNHVAFIIFIVLPAICSARLETTATLPVVASAKTFELSDASVLRIRHRVESPLQLPRGEPTSWYVVQLGDYQKHMVPALKSAGCTTPTLAKHEEIHTLLLKSITKEEAWGHLDDMNNLLTDVQLVSVYNYMAQHGRYAIRLEPRY